MLREAAARVQAGLAPRRGSPAARARRRGHRWRNGGGTGGGTAGGTGGGTAGGTGGGNAGGTGGTPALLLPCLTNLLASCEPQGACTSSSDAGVTAAICFESGVRVTYSKVSKTGACAGFSNVTVVTKADGSPCYSFESYFDSGMACEGERYTWRDAAGQLVASGVRNPYDNPSTRVLCTGGVASTCHNPAPLGASTPCCGITNLGTSQCMYASQQCTAGSCP